MTTIIIILILVFLVLWFISTYNKLIRARMSVKGAFATMDVYLKKRFDLIPNLVETVKGYMGHEHDTLTKIVELRNVNTNASSTSERMENESQMSGAIGRLLMVVENYPDLKANTQFLELQKELKDIESEIERSRNYYNGAVTTLNTLINVIPTNIVAGMCNIKEEPFFEITNKEERENVKVKF